MYTMRDFFMFYPNDNHTLLISYEFFVKEMLILCKLKMV